MTFFSIKIGSGDKWIADLVTKDGNKKETVKKIYINAHDEQKHGVLTDFKCGKHEHIRPIMCRQSNGHSNRVFCSGSSLAGKSFIASELAKSYHEQFPKHNICLFSYLDGDENYQWMKKLKCFKKIRIDNTLIEDPITIDELHDSLVIFDDIEHFSNRYLLKELEILRNSLLNAGRHVNADVIIVKQQLLDSHHTKPILNSAFQIYGFGQSASKYQLGQWLKRYINLDQKLIKRVMAVPSRWVCVNNSTCMYALHSQGCFMLA